jgi:hypothetical protein
MLGMFRIRPMQHNDDDQHVFRIVTNVESFLRNQERDQNDPSYGIINAAEERTPDLETIQAILDKMTAPYRFHGSDVIWATFFKINERIANGYRRGRAFIAGGKIESAYIKLFFILIFFSSFYKRCCPLSFTCGWPGHEFRHARW